MSAKSPCQQWCLVHHHTCLPPQPAIHLCKATHHTACVCMCIHWCCIWRFMILQWCSQPWTCNEILMYQVMTSPALSISPLSTSKPITTCWISMVLTPGALPCLFQNVCVVCMTVINKVPMHDCLWSQPVQLCLALKLCYRVCGAVRFVLQFACSIHCMLLAQTTLLGWCPRVRP